MFWSIETVKSCSNVVDTNTAQGTFFLAKQWVYSWQTKQVLGVRDQIFHSSLQQMFHICMHKLTKTVGKRGKNIINLHIGGNIAGNQLK